MNFEHRNSIAWIRGIRAEINFPVESDGRLVKQVTSLVEFREGEFVVYPAHGVGQITAIEVQAIAGISLEFFRDLFCENQDEGAAFQLKR